MRKLIAIAPLALLAGCGATSEEAAAPDPVAAVRTAVATVGQDSQSIEVFGVAEALPGDQRGMSIQAEARVDRILAPSGTQVRAGQVVAILSPSQTTRLDLAKARSDASAASAALARTMRLRKDGLVSDAEVDAARAAAQVANATLATTGQRSGTLALRAPMAGTVQNLTAKPGDLLAAGTTVATIGTQANLQARFGIDPALATRVSRGQAIKLGSSTSEARIETTISGIDLQPDPTTRQLSALARIPGGSGFALGQPLRASIAVGVMIDGVTVPYAALLDDGGKSFVFVIDKDTAHQVAVLPGSSAGDRIVILKGLKAGDRVVTEGGTALEDGMKVREDNPAAKAKAGAGK
ncbi:MAG: efflux RND transporter periplasmic adaptor subunit [Proteobacteria bacterium]|nr:efflux RND transporter periplasmic adaptor subunit [Pseudomonadota bacterium]